MVFAREAFEDIVGNEERLTCLKLVTTHIWALTFYVASYTPGPLLCLK